MLNNYIGCLRLRHQILTVHRLALTAASHLRSHHGTRGKRVGRVKRKLKHCDPTSTRVLVKNSMASVGGRLGGVGLEDRWVKEFQFSALRDHLGLPMEGGGRTSDGKLMITGRWSFPMYGPVVMVESCNEPLPRQRSRVEALPVAGSMRVRSSGDIRREKEALPARKSARKFPE